MRKIHKTIIFYILILLLIFPLNSNIFGETEEIYTDVNITANENEIISIENKLYTNCLLLVESNTGDILYEKNAYEKMYPASTTKILTAIITLEKCYLNERITVSAHAVNSVPSDYTTAGLKSGEEFTIEELLYALLLPSGNDAANVLAEYISGSIEEFAKLMNDKAKSIGLTDSNFTNPSGMHDENLYTTAYDLSLLARYAMKIDKFRQIVSTPSYTLPATSIHPNNDRTFTNSNLLLSKDSASYYYEYTTGIKTGFTSPAGDCLVASAKKDDIEFIVVCLNSGTLDNGLRQKFLDCKTLFEYAFDNYTLQYQNLQEKNFEVQEESYHENSLKEDNNNSSTSFFRTVIKFIAIIIILLSLKCIFFRKKKNRRKRFKTRKNRR